MISVTYCDDRGVDFTILDVEELENEEINDVQLTHDQESDVTISLTSFISSVYNFIIFVFLGLETDEIDT